MQSPHENTRNTQLKRNLTEKEEDSTSQMQSMQPPAFSVGAEGGLPGHPLSAVSQQKSSPDSEEEDKTSQQKSDGPISAGADALPPDDNPAQQKKGNASGGSGGGSGNGLPEEVQAKMENSFGTDFSNVNVHENSSSATENGALAYAQGNDVHFAPGQFRPNSQAGQDLIGHELSHVVQQREGRVQATTQAKSGMAVNDDKGLEAEADQQGAMAARGETISTAKSGGGGKENNSVQRKVAQRSWNVGLFEQALRDIAQETDPDVAHGQAGHPGTYDGRFPDTANRVLWNLHKSLHWRPEFGHDAAYWGRMAVRGMQELNPAINAFEHQRENPEGLHLEHDYSSELAEMLADRGISVQEPEPEQTPEPQQEPQQEQAPESQEEGPTTTTDLGIIGEARRGVGMQGHRFQRLYVNREVYEFFRRGRLRVRLNTLNTAMYNFGLEHTERADTDPTIAAQITELQNDLMAHLRSERERRQAPIQEATRERDTNEATAEGLRTGDLRPQVIQALELERAQRRAFALIRREEPDTAELDTEIARLRSGLTEGQTVPDLPEGADNLEEMSRAERVSFRQRAIRMRRSLERGALRPIHQAESARDRAATRLDRLQGRSSSSTEQVDHVLALLQAGHFLDTTQQSYWYIPGQGRRRNRRNMTLPPVRSLYRGAVRRTSGWQSGGNTRPTETLMRGVAGEHFDNEDDVTRAILILQTLARNEGNMDSINTWDRLSITLGPGLGGSTRQRDGSYVANGRFTTKLAAFRAAHPDIFYQFLGRFGVEMELRGTDANPTGRREGTRRRRRWQQMRVVVPQAQDGVPQAQEAHPPGTVLHGMDALNYIIEDPILTTQLRLLGQNEVWQRFLLDSIAESSIQVTFDMSIPIAGGAPIPLRSILNTFPAPLDAVCYATLNDQIHGVGNEEGAEQQTGAIYEALAAEHNFDPHDPASMPTAAREEFVRRLLSRPHMETRQNRINGYMSGIPNLRPELERLGIVSPEEE